MTICSLDILLSQFGTSLLFLVQFYLLLTDLHTDFSGGRSDGPVFPSLEEFSTVCCGLHNQRLWHSQWSRNGCFFLEFTCFFYDSKDVDNLISGSSAFSQASLNIWKFTVHILLKPSLENFEHYFASVWDEGGCVVVWTFFGITFWGTGMKTDLFQSCGHCWVSQICWYIEYSTLTEASFRIWNSSAGIPSPPLVWFIEMLPKAHLMLSCITTNLTRLWWLSWTACNSSRERLTKVSQVSVYPTRFMWRKAWQKTLEAVVGSIPSEPTWTQRKTRQRHSSSWL